MLRAGTFHEGVTIPDGKRVNIQSYPGEAVWLDGSSVVSGWNAEGRVWVHDGWTAQFDRSPTYAFGAADNTEPNWTFVNPEFPTAAWPDQVWVDGSALRQVRTPSEVVAGTFAVDYGTDRLYIGNDPSGRSVRASDIAKALSVRAAGTVLRGFGVRRFAPSVPHMGAVTLERTGILAENLVISDMATTGLSAITADITVRDVTIESSGMLGMHANYADRLLVEGLRSVGNNVERFNAAPVAGGFKMTKSRNITVRDSYFADNRGTGIWLDQSVYDSVLVRNDVVNNERHGLFVEISAKTVVADNLVLGNDGDGIKINNTSSAWVWNNTLNGNGRSIDIVQDSRLASELTFDGYDPRQPRPDPTVTWLIGPASVGNNVMANPQPGAACLLCVEDYSHQRTAEQMGVQANGNVYNRASANTPGWVSVWSRGAGNPAVFTTVSQFTATTGQERTGLGMDGTRVVDDQGRLTPDLVAQEGTIAQPLPAEVANVIGRASGSRHVGTWTG